jgi:cytokinin dehydrogenase
VQDPGRRSLITGLTAGALVLGLDPLTRSWVTAAHAGGGRPLDRLPALDGRLRLDDAALDAVADDFGHTVSRRPRAVLEPGSVRDIAAMMEYCRRHRIKVAGRGQGHSTNGQSQIEGGLIIDLGPLNSIEIHSDRAVVGAGATWLAFVQAALAQGKTPPVLTDYLGLSIGGTLSAGGLGGAIGHHGAQVDTVLELQVVTGTGEVVTCSRTKRRDLFDAVRSGLGQVGVIVKAVIKLVDAPSTARRYNLYYPSVEALTAEQRRVLDEGRFDYLEGQLARGEDGAWTFMMEAVAFDATPADDDRYIGDLGHSSVTIDDLTYFDFLNRIGPLVDLLIQLGEWQRPHPWLDSILPGSRANELVNGALPEMTPEMLGQSAVILLYPIPTAKVKAPLLRLADEKHAFLFSLLRTSSPGAADPAAMTAANRSLYERIRAAGGGWYPVGTLPLNKGDWRRHFGPAWPAFQRAKHTYDPSNILTPGQGIF